MKVLIIKEADIKILRERLELAKYKQHASQKPVDAIYRHFNYVVESWLIEQGL